MELRLFKNKDFSLLVFGQATSLFGDIFLNIALSLYVLRLTGSPEKFASILALGVIPQLLLGSFSGAIVDRLNKKKTIIILDLIRSLYLMILLGFFMQGDLDLSIIYVTVIVFSLCDIFFGPSVITIFPLILKKEELISGNALRNTVTEATKIAAPVLGALIFRLYGLKVVILVNAISYLISACTEFFMVIPKQTRSEEKGGFLKEVLEGFGVFFKDFRITSLVFNGILSHIFLFPFFLVGTPYLLIEVFSVSDVSYGIVEGIMPIGYILSMGLVSLSKGKLNMAESINFGIIGMLGSVLFVGLLALPGFDLLLHTNAILAVIFFGFINLMMFLSFGYYGVFFVSFYQENISSEYLGRFGSILIMLFALGRFIGFKSYGYLFSQPNYIYPVAILLLGMLLKLVVHIPFMKKEKSLQKAMEEIPS